MKRPRPSRFRRFGGLIWFFTRKTTRAAARVATGSVLVGATLALYGLATHYVDAMRAQSPLRLSGWWDVKAQVGNVFYAAAHNTAALPGNLWHGDWAAATANLTNMAGIRSSVYTQVLHAGATNQAETFTLWAPPVLGVLILLGMVRHFRAHTSAASYLARIGMVSATTTCLLLNSVLYYQGVTGLTGWLGYLGTGLAQVIDTVVSVGAGLLKEVVWHLFFMLTDGKEKTIGLLTDSRVAEDLSHYLAHFPADKVSVALHTAVYQALAAAGLLLLAHRRQTRLAQTETPAKKRRPTPRPGRRRRKPVKSRRRSRHRLTPRGD